MCRFFSCRAAAVALVLCGAWWAAVPADAEIIPLAEASEYASLTGRVYADLNASGELDPYEGLIPKVKILLDGITDDGEAYSATAWTDAQGVYRFDDLPAGTYSITEIQPVEFLQGKTTPPGQAAGGATADGDRYWGIVLAPGATVTSYDFRESGLRSAYVSKRYLLRYQGKSTPIPEPGMAALAVGLVLACLGRRSRPGS